MHPKDVGPRPYCYMGLLAAAVFIGGWMLGAYWDPSWTFGEDTISELGVSDVGATASAFLVICVTTALLAEGYALGRVMFGEGLDRASGYAMALSLVFLAALGIFSKDFGDGSTHNFCAVTFFAVIVVAVLLNLAYDLKRGNRPFAALTGILVVATAAVAVVSPLALTEAICVIAVMAWVISQSVKVLIGKA